MRFWYLFIFIALEGLIFLFHNFLYSSVALFKGDYFLAFIATLPVIIAIGAVLYSYLIESKEKQNRTLEHITRETLHEINLPISTIDANIKMLSKSLEKSKDLKKINRINSALDRLKRLYEQLRYEIKKDILPIEKEIVKLDILVEDRVEYFRQLKRNRFNLNLERLVIKIDKIGLEQTIDNVIENSMKYSSKDSDIDIEIKDSKLIVRDYGVGIGEDELTLIYQRYFRESNLVEGEGIGLNLVKSFCDNEGVLLKIESKKGVGTRVIFDFKSLVLTNLDS